MDKLVNRYSFSSRELTQHLATRRLDVAAARDLLGAEAARLQQSDPRQAALLTLVSATLPAADSAGNGDGYISSMAGPNEAQRLFAALQAAPDVSGYDGALELQTYDDNGSRPSPLAGVLNFLLASTAVKTVDLRLEKEMSMATFVSALDPGFHIDHVLLRNPNLNPTIKADLERIAGPSRRIDSASKAETLFGVLDRNWDPDRAPSLLLHNAEINPQTPAASLNAIGRLVSSILDAQAKGLSAPRLTDYPTVTEQALRSSLNRGFHLDTLLLSATDWNPALKAQLTELADPNRVISPAQVARLFGVMTNFDPNLAAGVQIQGAAGLNAVGKLLDKILLAQDQGLNPPPLSSFPQVTRSQFEKTLGASYLAMATLEAKLAGNLRLLARVQEIANGSTNLSAAHVATLFDALGPTRNGNGEATLELVINGQRNAGLAKVLDSLQSAAARQVHFTMEQHGATSINEVMCVKTDVPGANLTIEAHPSMPRDATGNIINLPTLPIGTGPLDQDELAKLIPPGTIAFIPASYYRMVGSAETGWTNDATSSHGDEAPKDYIGHAGIAVGIIDPVTGKPGVVIIETPANYGALTNPGYGVRGISKIDWPKDVDGKDILSTAEQMAYQKNITTVALLLSKYVPFAQQNFNGGDPLGVNDFNKIEQCGEQLVRALVGDEAAVAWLKSPENSMYCAELNSSALNIGLSFVLNDATFERTARKYVADHGEPALVSLLQSQGVTDTTNPIQRFVELSGARVNEGSYATATGIDQAHLVVVSTAPADLRPMKEVAPPAVGAQELAVKYESFTDIVVRYLRMHFPRKSVDIGTPADQAAAKAYNQVIAQVQAHAFNVSADRYEGLAGASLASDPLRTQWTQFRAAVAQTILTPFNSDRERHTAVAALEQMGQRFTPVDPVTGNAMFVHPASWLGNTVRDNKGIIGLKLEAWAYPGAAPNTQYGGEYGGEGEYGENTYWAQPV